MKRTAWTAAAVLAYHAGRIPHGAVLACGRPAQAPPGCDNPTHALPEGGDGAATP